jgi:hypothetical protein
MANKVSGRDSSNKTAQSWQSTCNNVEFEIVTGESSSDTERIAQGLQEWIKTIWSGTWGAWLQHRLAAFQKAWAQGVRRNQLVLVDDAAERERTHTPAQVFEAWKLLKIVFLQYFPQLLDPQLLEEKVVVDRSIPELIASFSAGKLQAVGKLHYTEGNPHVDFPLAVTRYTISYAVKGTEQAGAEKSGRVLLGGWIEENMVDLADLQENLIVTTFPASAFVRQHYIKNGAKNSCSQANEHTNGECDAMLEQSNNCDCNVKLCVLHKCLYYFQAGMCGTTTALDKLLGATKRCYGPTGFIGTCAV